MRIVKNLSDLSLNEDQKFFAEIIRDEFGYDTCVEDIKNKDFLIKYNKPRNNFTIYTTAHPTQEGVRMIAWKRG